MKKSIIIISKATFHAEIHNKFINILYRININKYKIDDKDITTEIMKYLPTDP
jgi:hypothetical protein